MMQFISLCSVLSIILYSVALSLCFMMYGKTGRKVFQYSGIAMFVAIVGSVGTAGQELLGIGYSGNTLMFAVILTFNIVEIYLFAKVIHTIFRKAISAAIYIWLCIIIMINGFISTYPVALALWLFIAFNISVIVLCVFYWEALVRETDEAQHQEAAKYNYIILGLAVCAIAALAYSITNLSLFQKVPSRTIIDGYYLIFGVIVSSWLVNFCQREYEAYTFCSMKQAFRAQQEPMEETEMIPEPMEEDVEVPEEAPNQMEQIRSHYDLTDREMEILRLILAGKSNQEIGEELFITVGTVKAHVHSIFGKLEVTRRSQLMTRFMELDL